MSGPRSKRVLQTLNKFVRVGEEVWVQTQLGVMRSECMLYSGIYTGRRKDETVLLKEILGKAQRNVTAAYGLG